MKTSYKNKFKGRPLSVSAMIILLSTGVLLSHKSSAQLNPLGAMYFQNQYLANPAMAGTGKGMNINLGYRKQWSSFPDAPTTQYLSADYRFADKASTGLIVHNEKAGLLSAINVKGTFAYHLPLSETRNLHMGLSLGVMSERLDTDGLTGDVDDPGIARFNDQGTAVEGDFGVAYTDDKLTIQASMPNMKSFFDATKEDVVNQSFFFAAVSYKIVLSEENSVGLEPKVCFRGINGNDNIIDVGANLTLLDNKLNVFGLYHSSKNTTLGLGFTLKKMVTITGMYTSTATTLSNNTSGNFEAGLRIALWGSSESQ